MGTAIVTGTVPLNVGRVPDGSWLTPDSFNGRRSGQAYACWKHWIEDTYVFKMPAMWQLDTEGLKVIHFLDDTVPEEVRVLQMIESGTPLFWSHGWHGAPADAREWRAKYERPGVRPQLPAHALKGEQLGHWSYVPESAFPQEPIAISISTRMIEGMGRWVQNRIA